MTARKTISLLLPAYNEAANLPEVFRRVEAVAAVLQPRYDVEFLLMDNCSTDGTSALCREKCAQDDRYRYLRYSRNFGAEASMLAGLDHARGDAAVFVYTDLQDPPELIPEMAAKWEEGNEVVYGLVRRRNDYSLFKTVGAKIYYGLLRRLADIALPENATDFRLMDRKVLDALGQLRERDRYLRGLVHWVGFRQTGIPYDRSPRVHGETKYPIWTSVKFGLNAVFCFSSKPLQIATYLGFFFTLLSVALGFFYLLLKLAPALGLPLPADIAPPLGVTTIVLLILLNLGLNTLFLGIVGQYLARVYNQGKQRPLYIVDEKIGF
ncbi:MAG: glycosyltransferase family 2 protein [Verrucomicrobium sp.]|nr:glycosyltransferase family 2 protein [Verrucomicrobium sp.]